MNFTDALRVQHGTDRMSVEADRRLRRRLGLESAPAARRVWVWPALGAFAVVAAIVAFVLFGSRETTAPTPAVAAIGPEGGTMTWRNASVVAAPGTQLTTSPAGELQLRRGEIQIHRSEVTPIAVTVPMGRVVIAAYHSSIKADRESFTFVIDDGSGEFVDANGQTHPLVPGVPLVSPKPSTAVDVKKPAPPPAPAPPAPPMPKKQTKLAPGLTPSTAPVESSGPPGMTVPRRPDEPCTFKSDCAEGQTCRKNEDGISVCMGRGLEGAACWFDNDCVSRTCEQRRCTASP